MKCPECDATGTKVKDSRDTGDLVWRRRECSACGLRFTTHERFERRLPFIVKKSGSREPYNHQKVHQGVAIACRKRPVSPQDLEAVVRGVETRLLALRASEVDSSVVGEAVMAELRDVDEVAYIRFCSVYHEFDGVEQFIDAIQPLQEDA